MSERTLMAYQDAFAAALLADDPAKAAPGLRALIAQPGFAVYRNTVLTGCIDALQANFPTIARLVGEEWFRAAAAVYAREHLPTRPSLLLYGETFPAFLAAFPPAAELPYLSAVARVDRAWSEAHVAVDEESLRAEALASLTPTEMTRARLRPHAAARWLWSDDWPIHTVWSRNRVDEEGDSSAVEWSGEGILLTRPVAAVQAVRLDAAGAAFLDGCASGRSIEQAVRAALHAEPDSSIAALVEQLLLAGAFSGLDAIDDPREGSTYQEKR